MPDTQDRLRPIIATEPEEVTATRRHAMEITPGQAHPDREACGSAPFDRAVEIAELQALGAGVTLLRQVLGRRH